MPSIAVPASSSAILRVVRVLVALAAQAAARSSVRRLQRREADALVALGG